MKRGFTRLAAAFATFVLVASCAGPTHLRREAIEDSDPEAQAELAEVVRGLAADIMAANVEGLQSIHLDSEKFTKFGPRNFERQGVAATNESEAAFFTSISETDYRVEDLRIDVFGPTAVVTYYPRLSFVQDGEPRSVSGRQTLVFLRTSDGWKIVHEHGTPRREPAVASGTGTANVAGSREFETDGGLELAVRSVVASGRL